MTAFFIRRPVLVCMLLLGACLLGTVSYRRLAVELMPFAELPPHADSQPRRDLGFPVSDAIYDELLPQSAPTPTSTPTLIPSRSWGQMWWFG